MLIQVFYRSTRSLGSPTSSSSLRGGFSKGDILLLSLLVPISFVAILITVAICCYKRRSGNAQTEAPKTAEMDADGSPWAYPGELEAHGTGIEMKNICDIQLPELEDTSGSALLIQSKASHDGADDASSLNGSPYSEPETRANARSRRHEPLHPYTTYKAANLEPEPKIKCNRTALLELEARMELCETTVMDLKSSVELKAAVRGGRPRVNPWRYGTLNKANFSQLSRRRPRRAKASSDFETMASANSLNPYG